VISERRLNGRSSELARVRPVGVARPGIRLEPLRYLSAPLRKTEDVRNCPAAAGGGGRAGGGGAE
jgi:hypothetical protein